MEGDNFTCSGPFCESVIDKRGMLPNTSGRIFCMKCRLKHSHIFAVCQIESVTTENKLTNSKWKGESFVNFELIVLRTALLEIKMDVA